MKNSCNKEETAKKYASFSNPESSKSTKTSVGASQYEQQRKNVESADINVLVERSDKISSKTSGNVLLHHSVQPHPFTFITAVKRKLALGRNYPTCKKAYEPKQINEEIEGTMAFIKPLKVPDLKISSKADYSSRESLLSNDELAKKIESAQRDEMSIKSIDRIPRKLEFSSSCTSSIFNYENVNPLKISEFSVSKKKDLSRDSSREKENRSKRVKKDDFNIKNKDDLQDMSKWSKPQRHISRKEIADLILSKKQKPDCILVHKPKDTDIILKKSKNRNFTTSTIKKDEEKRHKYSNIPTAKSKKDKFLDSKNRTSSSDSSYPIDKGTRLHEKILIREGCKAMISELNDRKYKDDSQIVNTSKQSDESKYKSHSETRLQKHQNKSNSIKPIESLTRDQSKRFLDKQKSTSKSESKHSSEISEDLTTAVNSIASVGKSLSAGTDAASSILSKSKDVEKIPQLNSRNSEEYKYSDTFSHAASSNPVSSSTIIETKISQDTSLSEKLMDSIRISFRDDSYSNQPEFVDLVTPDMNLMIRSKRRKQALQTWENDNDQKDFKQRPTKNGQDIEVQLKKLKAEMGLLDSFSKSLRQAINIERLKLSNDNVKSHKISLQNDHKDVDSKKTEAEFSESKDDGKNKIQKPSVKGVEVQTQTANDIATQTDTTLCQRTINTNLAYSRFSIDPTEIPHISLNSEDRYEDMDRVEDITLPSKMRTMSEISLHETTSSIKTETGTEISISTRDVTYSFNKYLDLEMAQLIKDERQRYDKIEMLFKSREKTLNDRTKKLVKLEEQKRALRDTGQDSRISSVKKKQRALLLKLQQEKDEMNRLKELHKIASQERKLMLQKQRDMFNPEMSTKNILNKLKRTADSQSPRRLSGPMKGYDIRSNSSVSSLVDSDKSQIDHSQIGFKLNLSDIMPQKDEQNCSKMELNRSLKQGLHGTENVDKKLSKIEASKQKEAAAAKLKYDLKMRKFEGKMPKSDQLKLKSQHYDVDAILKQGASAINLLKNENRASPSQVEDNKSISEHVKSESDVLIEEFTQIWKSQFPDLHSESFNLLEASNSLETLEEMQKTSPSKLDKETIKKLQQYVMSDNKNGKRKGVKSQRSKPVQTESTSKSEDSHYVEDTVKYHNKRSKIDSQQQFDDNYQNSILEEFDFNESQSSLHALLKHSNLLKERNHQLLQDIVDESRHTIAENSESPVSQKDEEENVRRGNASSRSQVSLTISHQSSNDSDRSYSRSVVIRSQQDHHHHRTGLKTSKKLEQILNARETTLVSRRNCVEEWIAWHAQLREEENRVARMEQAAYKLVTATAKALSHNDTTVSSDTSDVEGRIEQLTQKLADRRLEMARLKKELRKQAKQRLKALEANLLNEIKKYDATIHDMRKKLELRRGAVNKEIENLAIESKSVVDFKVPEIPIKKIQEIYRTSDLLRSKSDSDITSIKSQGKEEKSKDNNLKSSDTGKNLSRTKNTSQSKHSPSLYTVCDEEHESSEKSDHSVVHSYKTKSSSEEVATQKSIPAEGQGIKRSSSQSSNISEEIPSEAYSIKSQTEQIKTAKISEALTSQGLSERFEYGTSEALSKTDLKESSTIEEEVPLRSDDVSLNFSKKLDHIQLHNKELNNDIHNLEKDLKELTKLMSNFSKKSDEKNSRSADLTDTMKNSARSTSKDISEDLPVSEIVIQTDNIDGARVKSILSDVIPETDTLLASSEELDIRAKNLESINESNKSKLSGSTNKSTVTKEIHTDLSCHTENVNLSSHVNQYKNNGSYVSEILSTAIDEDKENTSPNESHYSIHTRSKSPDGVMISENVTECSDFEKLSSKHSQENKTNESVAFTKTKEIYTNKIIPSKVRENEPAKDRVNTLSKNKYTDTEISTAEDLSTNEEVSLKIKEIKANEEQIYTKTDNKYIKTKISIPKEISTDYNSSSSDNRKLASEDQIYTKIDDKYTESKISLHENISIDEVSLKNCNKETANNEIRSQIEDKCIGTEICITEEVDKATLKERIESNDEFAKTTAPDNEWSLSDSFSFEYSDSKGTKSNIQSKQTSNLKANKNDDRNEISAFDDSAMFIPKGESTNIQETFELKLDDSSEPRIGIRSDEFNDILEIIERETKNDDDVLKSELRVVEEHNMPQVDVKIDSPENCDVILTIKTQEDMSESIDEDIENKNDTSISEHISHEQILNDDDSPLIQIGVNIQMIDGEDEKSEKSEKAEVNEIKEFNGEDRISSDGEQLDNLIEMAEAKLETLEKLKSFDEKETENEDIESAAKPKTHVEVFLNRTFDVIKDPEYEDISEESLEVSEILDKTESHSNQKSKKFTTIPEKYISKSKSDEVLRILDDISNKSTNYFKKENRDTQVSDDSNDFKVLTSHDQYKGGVVAVTSTPVELNDLESANKKLSKEIELEVNSSEDYSKDEFVATQDGKSTAEDEDAREKQESPKSASESSETGGLDTPRDIPEIDMDSPRDANEDSRLDVDVLDDDLLSGNALLMPTHGNDAKTEFRTTPMGATSEKDIQAMIDKLKASLDQPDLEVGELDAKLLQLEHLEIELAIKRLEVEESYYVREIPNKPPPPYTPPGAVRLGSSHGSPSPPPAVIPSNVEELTAITEKATTIIYKAKEAGEDVFSLEAPSEICELAKDKSNDNLKNDRRIYNTFLFDLCKELVGEMYKSEYEGPGPSWTKPSVQTKPTVKIARTLNELNDYVSREVATLFGFKTKLQRENMVMRWSRKKRDMVDELLAKEAQAEEKEWTKFHHDELAVKNKLTIKILDTLLLETANCVKTTYMKKRNLATS